MAYNNGFPATYQPMFPQYISQPAPTTTQMPQSQNSPMIWVQGINAAKSYLMAPNMTLPLWDSEAQTIFLKSTDASGMPTMKILDYTIRQDAQTPQHNIIADPAPDYVTHVELTDLENRLVHKIDEMAKKKEVDAE